MKNNLPENWAVKNDGSQLFKDTVIKYLNDKYFAGYLDYLSNYYGETANDIFWGNAPFANSHLFTLEQFIDMTTEKKEPKFKAGDKVIAGNFSPICTITAHRYEDGVYKYAIEEDSSRLHIGTFREDFLTLAKFNPKRGDRVMVSDDEVAWESAILATYIEGSNYPVIVVYKGDENKFKQGNIFRTVGWKYMKPYEAPKIKLTFQQAAARLGIPVEELEIEGVNVEKK